jgi:oligoribonuclease NrnB/cAMP/cGMP phosphodiesterase (DHH superfamily)
MIPIDYGEPIPCHSFTKEDTVYMVDFSLDPESMAFLQSSIKELIWIDHHSTVIQQAILMGFRTPGIRLVGTAACVLTWRYLFPDKTLPPVVKLLGNYDVWDFSDPQTLPLHFRIKMLGLDPENWTYYGPLWKGLLFYTPETEFFAIQKLVSEGELLVAYQAQKDAEYAQRFAFNAQLMGKRPYSAIALNIGYANSRAFASVYDPSCHELMVAFILSKNGDWKVSLYSDHETIDCGSIAAHFNGGGHKGAAGFQTKILPLLEK